MGKKGSFLHSKWKQINRKWNVVQKATWIKTEVLFEGSQRNSTVLSCVGLALGSIIPTDMGISEINRHKQVNSKGFWVQTVWSKWKEAQSSALTQIKDAIPGPVPAPAFQLLMFCVLQSSVVKHHADNALKFRGINLKILKDDACLR